MSNSLITLVTSYLQGFATDFRDEFSLPCEVQLRGHMLSTALDVTFGSALWTGAGLLHVVAHNNAFLLTRTPSRSQRYYLYAVTRSKLPSHVVASAGFPGLRYTYLLPPGDIASLDVVDAETQHELLVLDADVKNYAKNAQ